MLYRSLLFAPGSDTKKMTKAYNLDADGIILDLEDAVAYSQKDAAREQVADFLTTPPVKPTFVRVNDAKSAFILSDIQAVVDKPIVGIFLAKTESAEEVRHVDWLLTLLEGQYNLPMQKLEIVAFLENTLGIEKAYEIATASPRVKRLAFGGNDYTTDIGTPYSNTGDEFFYARSRMVVASRAAGIEAPLDTVCPFIKDTDLLEEDAKRAQRLGFQGKMVIHPNQISPVNTIFSPTQKEIDYSRKIIAAFEEAEAKGTGVIQVDGKMIEYPIVNRARQVLAIAEAKGLG